MPGFAKSPPELIERFDVIAAEFPDVAKRLTFGYPCLYVGGNMVSGLWVERAIDFGATLPPKVPKPKAPKPKSKAG